MATLLPSLNLFGLGNLFGMAVKQRLKDVESACGQIATLWPGVAKYPQKKRPQRTAGGLRPQTAGGQPEDEGPPSLIVTGEIALGSASRPRLRVSKKKAPAG